MTLWAAPENKVKQEKYNYANNRRITHQHTGRIRIVTCQNADYKRNTDQQTAHQENRKGN